MLVLTRKQQQKLLIGDIEVTVIAIRGGSVRIGIEAPPETRIIREELEKRETTESAVFDIGR